jgi:hypothetical protein
MKYRKKPVVIDATRWFKNGDHPKDFTDDRDGFHDDELVAFTRQHAKDHGWGGAVVRYFRRPDVDGETPCRHCGLTMHVHGWIDTLEGGHIVCPGDWIITGVKGEYYPCKPDVFDSSYEAV